MNWLTLFFALELGLLPNYHFVMYEPGIDVAADNSLYTDFEATVEVRGFYLGGGMRCYFWKTKSGYDFSPFQMAYRFDAGWRNDILTVGFRHYCMHPVMPWASGMPSMNWEGGYEEVFVRLEGNTGNRR
jgi:hypothetical protein